MMAMTLKKDSPDNARISLLITNIFNSIQSFKKCKTFLILVYYKGRGLYFRHDTSQQQIKDKT